jgi:membrane associated rhomboid family serine protease
MLVPLEEDNPLKGTPWAIYTLIAINSAIFLSVVFLPSYEHILDSFGFTPAHWTWPTVLTSMFLHVGFWHLAGNMFFFWLFGDNVEDVLRAPRFLGVYFLSGLGATFTHYAFGPESAIPCVGSSGAISGIAGVYLVFFPRARMQLVLVLRWSYINIARTNAVCGLGIWFGEQVLLGAIVQSLGGAGQGGIAFWAHAGGFAAGVLFGLVFRAEGALRRYGARPSTVTTTVRLSRRRSSGGR